MVDPAPQTPSETGICSRPAPEHLWELDGPPLLSVSIPTRLSSQLQAPLFTVKMRGVCAKTRIKVPPRLLKHQTCFFPSMTRSISTRHAVFICYLMPFQLCHPSLYCAMTVLNANIRPFNSNVESSKSHTLYLAVCTQKYFRPFQNGRTPQKLNSFYVTP